MTRDLDRDVAHAVEEPVDRLAAVPARHDDRPRPELMDRERELTPLDVIRVGDPDERTCLVEVRRDHRREREEPRDEHRDGVVLEELGARRGNHHRVDDEGNGLIDEEIGDSLDDPRAEEHACLRRVDADVSEDGLELAADEVGRRFVDGADLSRGLSRQRDDRAHAMAAEVRERLEVGLDAGAAAGVGARDREAAWYHGLVRLAGGSAPILASEKRAQQGHRKGSYLKSTDPTADAAERCFAAARARGVRRVVHYLMRLASGFVATVAAAWDELLSGEELAYVTEVPAREADIVPLPENLHPRVRDTLAAQGLTALYRHQAEAFTAASRGEHIVVSTGTASGKTLAFNLPVLDAVAAEPKLRALYLYPTKALAQDQARALSSYGLPRLRPAIYDGDTETERRWQIRKWANVILTNPDMLHVGVLPHHDRWGDVLQNLRYVVVDEAHVYRGVFGSHVGNVLRRLRRAAAIYGADPQFLLASATIANPGDLVESLLGLRANVIGDDAAPRAARTVAFWNPPVIDEKLQLRASALGEGSRLLADLVQAGLRTICFAKSRKSAELIHRFASERVGAELAQRLSPYRAGYTPAQRRDIERRLVEGELLGVTATDALELGIDIGLLDCAISVGFPGTVASLRQQWGRAGRRAKGLAVLVASEDALDQFFMREPELLMGRQVEAAILDHANPRVLDGHVCAAAFEAPLDQHDAAYLGPEALERAGSLAVAGELKETRAGYVWAGRDYPAARFSLRSTTPDAFSVVDVATGSILGLVERERAYSTVHEGAIYLHLGESYRVLELDLDARMALVEQFQSDYYTQPKKETTTAIEQPQVTARRLGMEVSFGTVAVTEQVVAYQKKAIRDQATLELVALELPETTFETEAVWYLPEQWMLEGLEAIERLLGSLHAAEHSMIALLPLWAMCDRWDIGGLSTNLHFQTGRPTVFIYDGHAGGVGIARRGFDQLEGWVADTEQLLAGCPCEAGCPSCVQSPKCGNLNEFLDKAGALTLLRRMVASR
jgi:DEAD/DEAH box helicase domain-containing protein